MVPNFELFSVDNHRIVAAAVLEARARAHDQVTDGAHSESC